MELDSAQSGNSNSLWLADGDLACEVSGDMGACLKAELEPGERLLWAARACPPLVPTIDAFPAFFTALLCGLSGFALSVMFGIYGLVALSPTKAALVFGLGPAVLGFFILLVLVGRRIRYRRTRWRLARTFYGLTDRRAIVAMDHGGGEPIWFSSLPFDKIHDTLCIEHEDGTGDVYFVGDEFAMDPEGYKQIFTDVVSPELGLVAVPRAREVADMVRRILMGSRREPCWTIE